LTSIRNLTLVALFAAATGASALFVIPNPFVPTVPFTLQVLAVLLSGITLGPGLALVTQIVYLLLGVAGLPVYAGGTAGLAHLLGPTGGFLLSYPLAAAVAGAVAGRKPGIERAFTAALTGVAVIYVAGFAGLHVFAGIPLTSKAAMPLLTFLPWDLAKGALAAIVGTRLRKALW